MMKKLLVLLLVACMLITSMVSCDVLGEGTDTTDASSTTTTDGGSQQPDETTSPGEQQPQESETLKIAEDGVPLFRIIRPDVENADTIAAARKILVAIEDITGKTPVITTDWKKPTEEYDNNTYEILVGATGYSQSTEAMNSVKYGSYILTTSGNKIIVGGYLGVATNYAASLLITAMRKGTVDGAVTKDENGNDVQTKSIIVNRADITEKTGTSNTTVNYLPKMSGGTPSSVYDCGNNATMLIIKSGSADVFNAYKETATGEGFTQYATNEMAGNLFATYTNEKYVINAIFAKFDKSIRLIIEPLSATALPGLESENKYTKTTTSQFTMAGLESSSVVNTVAGTASYQNGMCFIIRLADGSFIIEDGGFNLSADATRILKILKAQNTNGGKPVVAAWIISHIHGDHCGALYNFADNSAYVNSITVEKFILNQPAPAQANITSTTGYRDLITRMKRFTGAEIIKAHPGQTFYLRNAKIDILYTLEMYAPVDLAYFNTSTVVFHVEIDGQKIMMLGDCSEPANAIICKMYGNFLKSDITTVAHHGYSGGSTQLHTYINPTWVFWPMGLYDYNERGYKNQSRSAFFFSSKDVKGIYVAGKTVREFPIPFTGEGVIEYAG